MILLNSLPDSYDHLVTTLIHVKETIKFEDVPKALMNDEIRHADKQNNASTLDALVLEGDMLKGEIITVEINFILVQEETPKIEEV